MCLFGRAVVTFISELLKKDKHFPPELHQVLVCPTVQWLISDGDKFHFQCQETKSRQTNMAGSVDVSGMSDQIQAEMQVKQFRDFLVQYNKLSESCFNDCVWDFTSRSIRNNEDNCVMNCVEKYTKVIFFIFLSCGCILMCFTL